MSGEIFLIPSLRPCVRGYSKSTPGACKIASEIADKLVSAPGPEEADGKAGRAVIRTISSAVWCREVDTAELSGLARIARDFA